MGRIRHIDGELHCVAKHRDAARFLSNFYVNTVYRGPFFEYTVWTGIEVGTFGPFCYIPRRPKFGPSVKRNGPNVTFHALSNDFSYITSHTRFVLWSHCYNFKWHYFIKFFS